MMKSHRLLCSMILSGSCLLMTFHCCPAQSAKVNIRLEVTNAGGIPVSTIGAGDDFFLNSYVQDIRPSPLGVFSAYMDVIYPSSLAAVSGPISYGDAFPFAQRGDTATPGLIDEVGATDGIDPLGGAEFLLFTVPMSADTEGVAVIASEPADDPFSEITVRGENDPVPSSLVNYGVVTLRIVPEPLVTGFSTWLLLGFLMSVLRRTPSR